MATDGEAEFEHGSAIISSVPTAFFKEKACKKRWGRSQGITARKVRRREVKGWTTRLLKTRDIATTASVTRKLTRYKIKSKNTTLSPFVAISADLAYGPPKDDFVLVRLHRGRTWSAAKTVLGDGPARAVGERLFYVSTGQLSIQDLAKKLQKANRGMRDIGQPETFVSICKSFADPLIHITPPRKRWSMAKGRIQEEFGRAPGLIYIQGPSAEFSDRVNLFFFEKGNLLPKR